MVSNCGKNEFGSATGGLAGDQTGKEFWLINWYNFGQSVVYRYPNKVVADLIGDIAEKSAKNDNIGYDQNTRLSFHTQLKNFNWHPEKIIAPCNADCSSATAAIVIACGHQLMENEDKNLRKIGERFVEMMSPMDTTWNIGEDLANCGFIALRETKYLSSDAFLRKGDINLNDSSHVNVVVSDGFKIPEEDEEIKHEEYPPKSYGYVTLQLGDGLNRPRNDVKAMQCCLLMNGYSLEADGEYGTVTRQKVKEFQRERDLKIDGICGPATWQELIKVEK